MDKQSKRAVSWLIFFLFVAMAAFAVTFLEFEKGQDKIKHLEEQVVLYKAVVSKQECILAYDLIDPGKESLCIYNDGMSHKVITLKAEDGTTVYGVKPYGSNKITACWR